MQPPPPAGVPPPPPPPSEDHLCAERLGGVELCGDEPWFSETAVRKRLRESVAEAHKDLGERDSLIPGHHSTLRAHADF